MFKFTSKNQTGKEKSQISLSIISVGLEKISNFANPELIPLLIIK